MNYLVKCIREYATFNGRARRKEFWTFIIATYGISFIFTLLNMFFFIGWLSSIFSLFIIIPTLAVTTRRLHDIGKSGKWIFAFLGVSLLISLIGMGLIFSYFMPEIESIFENTLFLESDMARQAMDDLEMKLFPLGIGLAIIANLFPIIVLSKAGDEGENEYGPDPKEEEIDI